METLADCFGRTQLLVVALILFAPATASRAATDGDSHLVAWWRFDMIGDSSDKEVVDGVSATFVRDDRCEFKDQLTGFHKLARGVAGNALRLGGIDAFVVRDAKSAPKLSGPLTIEAWIAVGAYPTNWCPLIAQADDSRGVAFGINARGHFGIQLGIDGSWEAVESGDVIPLNQWTHIACTYDSQGRVAIYRDGHLAGERQIKGELFAAPDQDLLIGKSPVERRPVGTIRAQATAKVRTYFDGLLDELKIYDRAMSSPEISESYLSSKPAESPELPERHLPGGPADAGMFGAFYTKLDYYDAWDAKWRVSPLADVVVRFDDTPAKLVFWRGASYIPHWVTENGIWYDNEFIETWSDHGCHEPMSDKQCRFSQVRVIESNEARAVVHWRYALVDNWYQLSERDETNSWGEWVDEIYTIYPDGVAVRAVTLTSPDVHAPHEWHEGIIVMGPGQRPEDVLDPEALTLVNMQGEAHTYSWLHGPPAPPTKPANANIEVVNTKSKYKPFLAVSPSSKPVFDIYAGEIRPEVSLFPWWNHWPTAFDGCDGRYALFADRASHSSLTHCTWSAYKETPTSMTKLMLVGLTHKSSDRVAQLARSWDSSPRLSLVGNEFVGGEYDPTERAYLVRRTTADDTAALTMRVDASDESPIVNLAMVVAGWGNRDVAVTVDGKSPNFYTAHRVGLESTDLILWIEYETTQPALVIITP